ncbi:hypothetical protein AB0E14_34775, partial [Streptomyces sp. NPDC047981]
MSVPVFEEFEPAADCGCAGCAQQRRDLVLGLPVRAGGHPAAHGARRALVLVTAAGVVLGGGGAGALALPSDGPVAPTGLLTDLDAAGPVDDTPQGGAGPLHGAPGPGGRAAPRAAPPHTHETTPARRRSTPAAIKKELVSHARHPGV